MSILIVEALIKIIIIIGILMTGVAYLTLAERKVSAFMQDRKGPNRVGPFGLFQPVADGIKFIFKEDFLPEDAYKPLYLLAPLIILIPALCTFAVIPFGSSIKIGQKTYEMIISKDMNLAILYLLSLSSVGVYGIILAGWSSFNKYSLFGSLRGASQVISYELGISLSVLSVIMAAGTMDLSKIVEAQKGIPFVIPHFLGFLVFLVSAFAETNRLPFDLPEGESEIVAGYHTEYSGMRFATFFMAEYANIITSCAIMVTLFFGGWLVPFVSLSDMDPLWAGIISFLSFSTKTAIFCFFFIWVRWTLPRFRYDQLMSLGWKKLFPVALFNFLLIATIIWLRSPR